MTSLGAHHRGQVATRLSLLLSSTGRREEAFALAGEARAAIPATCVPVRALSMAATARAHPDPTEASLTTAAEAVALTPESMPNQKADLLAELALVQAAAGREDQSLASLEFATDFYTRKGNVAAVRLLERP